MPTIRKTREVELRVRYGRATRALVHYDTNNVLFLIAWETRMKRCYHWHRFFFYTGFGTCLDANGHVRMSLIYFDAELFIARGWELCNTIEMTLGRVLGVDLGIILTLATIEEGDR